MRKLLFLLPLLAFTAEAQTESSPISLGERTCGMGRCLTTSGLETWATFRMSAILGCAPNNGNGCPSVTPGDWYELHVNVRISPGQPSTHARVWGKAGPIPTINKTLEWSVVDSDGLVCPIHGYPPPWSSQ